MKKKTPKKPKSKSKAKAKPAKKSKGKKKSFSKLTEYVSGMQKSPFMVAVKAAVLNSPSGTTKWPLASASSATAIPDLTAAMQMMLLVADGKSPLGSPVPEFAEQLVKDLRTNLPWPAAGDADVPLEWKTDDNQVFSANHLRAYRLWEAAHAMTYLIESWAKSGGGGNPKPNFPPPPPP